MARELGAQNENMTQNETGRTGRVQKRKHFPTFETIVETKLRSQSELKCARD